MPDFAVFSPDYGKKIKTVVDGFLPSGSKPFKPGDPRGVMSGFSSPVEISSEWEQEQELWKCKAKRLWKIGGKYQTNGSEEIELYDPYSENKPPYKKEDRVFAVWRGVWELSGSGKSTLFPVKLEKTGGEQGDDEKAASWTYTVKDALSNEQLETTVNPTAAPHQFRRPAIGAMTAATFGYAHYDNNNKLVLGWINEVIELAKCIEEEE